MYSPNWRTVLRNRNFRLLWIAQIVSELGDWFYILAVCDLLLELTGHKAQAVGLAVVVNVLPQALVAPGAGVANDRFSRKRIMIVADVARCFLVLGMLLVRTPGMVWMVYPLLLLGTVASAFFEPARNAVVPNIVSRNEVLAANALGSITWSCCLAVGAALGGVAAVAFGRDVVFVLNAASFLASAWLIRRMRFAEPQAEGAPAVRGRDLLDFTQVLEGVRYIRGDGPLLSTVFVKFGLGLLGASNVLLPVLGERAFSLHVRGLDPSRGAMLGMSLLMGARGAGSLVGPLAASLWAGDCQSKLRTGILLGFVLAAAGYVWLGMGAGLAIAVVAVVVAHVGSSTNWVFSTTLLQLHTEDRFRGRVFAADMGLNTLAISISSYLFGVALDAGLLARDAAVCLGLAMLVPAAIWGVALRRARKESCCAVRAPLCEVTH